MDLPFAVENNPNSLSILGQSSASSLVTASSQGSISQQHRDSYEPGVRSIFSQFGLNTDSNVEHANQRSVIRHPQHFSPQSDKYEDISSTTVLVSDPKNHNNNNTSSDANDLNTYVNVCETDADEVDVIIPGVATVDYSRSGIQTRYRSGMRKYGNNVNGGTKSVQRQSDVLQFLLNRQQQDQHQAADSVIECIEEGNKQAELARQAKISDDIQRALDCHTMAAKSFYQAATLLKDCNVSVTEPLLMLSQREAKAALTIKRIVKLHPNVVQAKGNVVTTAKTLETPSSPKLSHRDRLRATLRGALGHSSTAQEADMSESVFLGKSNRQSDTATKSNNIASMSNVMIPRQISLNGGNKNSAKTESTGSSNPVDDMMALERELRNMDLALEMGSSIASLDVRSHANKAFPSDGSYMVVPPDASTYMSSSMVLNAPKPPQHRSVNARQVNVPQRKNRVSNMLEASSSRAAVVKAQPPPISVTNTSHQQSAQPRSSSLESSWWGNSSTASISLSSSVVSLANTMSTAVGGGGAKSQQKQGSNNGNGSYANDFANTKQLMRLMDSLKTLGDENAALLREVEGAEAARREAKEVKSQMKQFKLEYTDRFNSLKAALDKFRTDYPASQNAADDVNPVTTSEFLRSKIASEQLQRQEQLIKKLTHDLKKEKDESKKKDAILRKYEGFYREVKARSAQKSAQKGKDGGGKGGSDGGRPQKT